MNKFISWKEKKAADSVTMPDKLPYIDGFQFNDQADLTSITAIRVSIKSTGSGQTEISLAPFIPKQSLHAPANTSHVLFKMILIRINFQDAETELLGNTELEIPCINEMFQPPVLSMPSVLNPGNLVIVVLAVRYMVNRNGEVEMLNDKKKLPCGIAWAKFI